MRSFFWVINQILNKYYGLENEGALYKRFSSKLEIYGDGE